MDFFVTAVVAKNFAGNRQDNAVGGCEDDNVVHLLRAVIIVYLARKQSRFIIAAVITGF